MSAAHEPQLAPLDVAASVEQMLPVHERAMASSTGMAVNDERVDIYLRHAQRPSFRAVGAHVGEQLVGFVYGYVEQRGGWWDGYVRPAMRAAGTERWLDDAFTIAELQVTPEWQGRRLGEQLLRAVLAGATQRRVLLTTQRDSNRARAFYDRLGFTWLADVDFPALPTFVVLGRELPLP